MPRWLIIDRHICAAFESPARQHYRLPAISPHGFLSALYATSHEYKLQRRGIKSRRYQNLKFEYVAANQSIRGGRR